MKKRILYQIINVTDRRVCGVYFKKAEAQDMLSRFRNWNIKVKYCLVSQVVFDYGD